MPEGRRCQHPYLVHQTRIDHAAEPVFDPPVDLIGRDEEADLRRPIHGIRLEPGSERREGSARPDRDLQGSDDPPAIGRLHPRRRHRIERGEAGVQVGRPGATLLQLSLQSGGHVGEASRDLEVVDDGAQVEAGTADQQRVMAPSRNVLQRPARRQLGTR